MSRHRSSCHRPTHLGGPLLAQLLLGLGLLIGILALVNGVRLATAGLSDFQARAFLIDWEKAGAEPSARAWHIAAHAAERATRSSPTANGEYLERLGHVQLWRNWRAPFGTPSAEPQRRAARDAYRAATQARPTWPQAWAALAYAKLHLLEFDAEFRHAMAEARRLGPWRPAINSRLAEIGFIAWPQLSESERAATLDSARRALPMGAAQAAHLFSLARSVGQHTALCQPLTDTTIARFKLNCPPAKNS